MSLRQVFLVWTAVLLAAASGHALGQSCPLTSTNAGRFPVFARPDGPVLFRSGLAVNLDGAPNAYHRVLGPTSTDPGLLHICNGVSVLELVQGQLRDRYPDFGVQGSSARCKADVFRLQEAGFPACSTGLCLRVFGMVAPQRSCGFNRPGDNCGIPIQRPDEAGRPTGFFISATSWMRPGGAAGTQSSYLDARFIPHFVLPGGEAGPFGTQFGTRLGDLALIVWRGRGTFAVFADAGPGSKLGEATPAVFNRLRGIPDSERPQRRGIDANQDGPAATLLLARRGMPFPDNAAQVQAAGRAALEAAGGLAAFRACPGLGEPVTIAEQ